MGLVNGDYMNFPSLGSSATDTSWTDDLPPCSATGVGFSPNQTYRRDGYRSAEHALEDQSFHFQLDTNICLYGVFDGHCGTQASLFAKQRMPAEFLLGQLSEQSMEEEIHVVLRQAFESVEQEYFELTIGNKLAERATLLSELPEGDGIYQTFHNFPQLQTQLEELNLAVASGTTAVVVLIVYGKLFVSNVGDSRALLCCTDGNDVLRVIQLSVDHDLSNEGELRRLRDLNVDTSRICQMARLGNQACTRCLGNYLVKGGYKEFDTLASAVSEPVIAEPDIHPSVVLDGSCRFLMLLSDGLHRALAEASDGSNVNIQLAEMVVDEFETQTSLTGVAQAVVDKVSRMHHEFFMSSSGSAPRVNKRNDMTLLVRNFNFPLPNSVSSPMNGRSQPFPATNSYSSAVTSSSLAESPLSPLPKIVLSSPNMTITNTEASTSTESSDLLTQSVLKLPLDANGRIQPYVDFSDYYKSAGSVSTLIAPEESTSQ